MPGGWHTFYLNKMGIGILIVCPCMGKIYNELYYFFRLVTKEYGILRFPFPRPISILFLFEP